MRAFPAIYARDVDGLARFYERLGFERHFQLPPEGDPGFVGLRRAEGAELAVVTEDSPRQLAGVEPGSGPCFEMFVYVEALDELVERLGDEGATVLREPADMPWGERVAYVADPEGNPVALCEAR